MSGSHAISSQQTFHSALMAKLLPLSLIATAISIPISIAATNSFLILSVIFSLLRPLPQQSWHKVWRHPLTWLSLGFFLLFCLGLIYSDAAWHDRARTLHRYSKLLFIPFILSMNIDEKVRHHCVIAFLATLILTLCLAYLKHFHFINFGRQPDATSLFQNHIKTTFLLGFLLYFSLVKTHYRPLHGVLFAILALLTLIALLGMSYARTGYVIACGIFFYTCWQRGKWRGIIISVVALAVILLAAYYTLPRFATTMNITTHHLLNHKNHGEDSTDLRINFLRNSWILFKQHPIIGSGSGSFQKNYFEHFGSVPLPDEKHLRTPHNEYVFIAVELGIVGFLYFLGMLAYQLYFTKRLPIARRDIAQGIVVLLAIGCLCDNLLYASVTGQFYVFFSALLFAV